jgi:hypothetical protein
MKKLFVMVMVLVSYCLGASAEVDPNFYVYLCFGQSNMEGNAQWESVDNEVDSRFQMLSTTDFDNPKRTLGNWYTAKCPIVNPIGKLGPSDYFGRTMVAAMPADVKIGVVAVAMGGSPIEMFDKDKYEQKLKQNPNEWWATLAKNYYGGNPYGRLIDMAKKAQEVGVIKGILLHQGCSNCGDPNWPNMVKKIYNDMLTDLGLQAEDVPLFVGEVEYENMGGGCASHNTVVAKIPSVIPTGHVVSAEGIPGNGSDAWHFSPAGYRTLGKRYAYEVLKVMGRETKADAAYDMSDNLKKFYTLKSFENIASLKAGSKVKLPVWGTFADGHREYLTAEAQVRSNDFTFEDGKLVANEEKSGMVTVTYTDFMGQQHTQDITVTVGGSGIGQRFTSLDAIGSQHFAIVNEEEGKALYGTDNQNLAYDVLEKAFLDTNSGYLFKLETSNANNGYLLRLIKPNGSEYSIWGNPGYLNSQPVDGWCSFILGLNNQNGQDIKDGAVWDIQYVDGKGFTLKNVGTGLYLHDAAPAKYDTPTYFTFCTLGSTTGVKTIRLDRGDDTAIYDLLGRRVHADTLTPGIYIRNGKKYIVK